MRTRVGTIALSLAIAACGAQAPAPREVPERVERPVTEYETDAGRRAPTRTEPPHQAPPPEYGHRIVRGAPDAGTDATER